MDLGPHTSFIVAAYGATAGILAVLLGWLLRDAKRQRGRLAQLEARGVRRKSAGVAKHAGQ